MGVSIEVFDLKSARTHHISTASCPEGTLDISPPRRVRIEDWIRAPAGAAEIARRPFRRPCRGSPHFVVGTGGLQSPRRPNVRDASGVRYRCRPKQSLPLEKVFELLCDDFKRQLLRGDGLHLGNRFLIMRPVSQQTERGLSDLVDGAGETAAFRKSETIDRAISSDARNTAKQGVAGDLSRNKTGIELEDDLMPGDFSKVIGVRKFAIEYAQFIGS